MQEVIARTSDTINSAQLSISQLSHSSAWVRKTLRTYEREPQSVSQSPIHDLFTLATMEDVMDNADSYGSPSFTLPPHLSEAALDANVGRINLGFGYISLHTYILSVETALRQKRIVLRVNSARLKRSSSTDEAVSADIKAITDTLSAIRRVPEEIWYEILGRRIAIDNHYWPYKTIKGVFLPALSFCHVCCLWRRIIFNSPSMWRAIHWNLRYNQEPNPDLLALWRSRSPDIMIRIYERLSYAGVPKGAFGRERFQLPVDQKLQYFLHQDKSFSKHSGRVQDTTQCSVLLIRTSKSPIRTRTLQRRLLKIFPALETLCLEGVLPKQGLNMPDSLKILSIVFDRPHNTYPLADILTERLTFLKLIHFTEKGTPSPQATIRLPNLVTLEITPLEHEIAARLYLPSLEKLRIYPPESSTATYSSDWLDSLLPHCANLRTLCLDLNSAANSRCATSFSFDRIHILRYLRVHAHQLRKLTFNKGYLSGSLLADFVERDQQEYWSRFEEVTIHGCTGVSRMDCDRLLRLVPKLNVYESAFSCIRNGYPLRKVFTAFHGDSRLTLCQREFSQFHLTSTTFMSHVRMTLPCNFHRYDQPL